MTPQQLVNLGRQTAGQSIPGTTMVPGDDSHLTPGSSAVGNPELIAAETVGTPTASWGGQGQQRAAPPRVDVPQVPAGPPPGFMPSSSAGVAGVLVTVLIVLALGGAVVFLVRR